MSNDNVKLVQDGYAAFGRGDIPYVLELLVYPFLGSANHTADYVESPGKLPALVIDSVLEFAKPEYRVDLLKLESPWAANDLPPRDGSAAAKLAQNEFDAIGEICREHDIPWVLLSGGAARDKFERVLEYAYAAGAGGFQKRAAENLHGIHPVAYCLMP